MTFKRDYKAFDFLLAILVLLAVAFGDRKSTRLNSSH